jgi:hypothetical protein
MVPEIGDALTLLDVARRTDDGGNIARIAEMMTQTNEILIDMPWVESNETSGHKSTIRNGLPQPTWRKLNYGVKQSKSTTTQVIDTCGMLEDYGQVDKDLAELNGNSLAFRLSEDRAHIEGMNQEMASMLFYGDTTADPEKILGLSPRYDTPSVDEKSIGCNIIDGGAAVGQTDLTSLWLVVWGPETIFGIYPKGSKAGLIHEDLGLETVTDAQGGLYRAYRSHFQWKSGLCVKDWRYAIRIANLDVSALKTAGDNEDTSANLCKKMIEAIEMIPALGMGNAVFYCNRRVRTALRIQLMNKSNVFLSVEDFTGAGGITRKELAFQGIPVHRVDKIVNNESALAFN